MFSQEYINAKQTLLNDMKQRREESNQRQIDLANQRHVQSVLETEQRCEDMRTNAMAQYELLKQKMLNKA